MAGKVLIRYESKHIGNIHHLIVYAQPGDDPNTQCKVVLPRRVIKTIIAWNHQAT